jgi:hypothetical protein
MKKLLGTFVCILICMTAFGGDFLSLTNGQYFEGKITKIKGSCEVVFKSAGEKYIIPASDIAFVQFENVNNRVYRDYMALAGPEACMQGSLDASRFHGKKGGHVALGFFFGPLAMIGTLLANPTPEKGKTTYMLSENKDLFSNYEYITCYKKEAKTGLISMEAIGWGGWLLLAIL